MRLFRELLHSPTVLWRSSAGGEASVLEAYSASQLWRLSTRIGGVLLAVIAFALVAPIPAETFPTPAKPMLAIFVLAAAYWSTGAIRPYATAILVMALMVFLLGIPALHELPATEERPQLVGWEQFIAPAAAPVIILMLGGFALGRAAEKHAVNRMLALVFLKPFGTNPRILVLGVMLISAVFSMWVSNTATAAMMITLVSPLIADIPRESSWRKALLLAIPLGSNIGGIGTPIGTPPNAIVFGALRAAGIDITFLGWMLFAVPLAAALLLFAWLVLLKLYADADAGAGLAINWPTLPHSLSGRQVVVIATFAITAGLWISSGWTGLPIGAIAMLPILAFAATEILDRTDINSLDWDILILMAGGLALGTGMQDTGLADVLVGTVPTEGLPGVVLIALIGGVTLTLSTFMSNTAVANLMAALAPGLLATGLSMMQLGVAIAFSASLAMSLPVSTPPNAIAYASGSLGITDFIRLGVAVGVVGVLLVTGLAMVV